MIILLLMILSLGLVTSTALLSPTSELTSPRPTSVLTESRTYPLYTSSTGRISFTVMSSSDRATWFIRPLAASYIQIIIENININQAELRILDTSQQGSGKTILNCVQCGSSIPPPLKSSTSSVMISIQGISGVSFTQSSFTLYFIAIPDDVISLPTEISINLNMGYNSIIPYTVNNTAPRNATQRWVIRQLPGTLITFVFDSFEFSNADCGDKLVVFDSIEPATGKVIFFGCHSTDLPKRWFYSRTGYALVIFTTSLLRPSRSTFNLKYYTNTPWYSCGSLFWPEIYRGESMLIMDGSGPNLMRRGDSCSWRISPSIDGTVTLIMSDVSLKFGASVIIYDGADVTGFELWRASGATVITPPIIRSSGSSLFLLYISDTSDPVRYTGFLGETYTNYVGSVGSGRGFSTLTMSSEIDIIPPGDGISVMSDSLNYTWFIKPSYMLGSKIIFGISHLNLSSIVQLSLYDGDLANVSAPSTLLATFDISSNLSRRWFWTSQPAATLVLTSLNMDRSINNSTTSGIFKISYFADGPNYHCGFTRNPVRLRLKSWTITDGSQSTETIYNSQHCEWVIDLSDYGDVLGIYVFFKRYHLIHGYLAIFIGEIDDGNLYTTIADTLAIPSPLYLPFPLVSLVYHSQASAYGFGFSLTYFAVTSNSYDSFSGDDIVYLKSSSSLSFAQNPSVIVYSNKTVNSVANKTWLICPPSSIGSLLIIPKILPASASKFSLSFFDGLLKQSSILMKYSSSSINATIDTSPQNFKWLVATTTSSLVTFEASISDNSSPINFDFAYYSDGPSYHCGFIKNPAILSAPSMIFSDGSGSRAAMYHSQSCNYIIEPKLSIDAFGNAKESSFPFMIILEFLECNMSGASIHVYEGKVDSEDLLLWSCVNCQFVPKPIISAAQSMTIVYSSSPFGVLGSGFTAVYWTAKVADWRTPTRSLKKLYESNSILLDVPEGYEFSTNLNSFVATRYHLPVDPATNYQLNFFPKYAAIAVDIDGQFNEQVFDGRPAPTPFNINTPSLQSSTSTFRSCGILTTNSLDRGHGKSFLKDPAVFYSPSQNIDKLLKSTIETKDFYSISGLQSDGVTALNEALINPVGVCLYWLDSGSTQAIELSLTKTAFTLNGRLRIYGGIRGNDSLLYDSNLKHHRLTIENVTLPCGKGFLLSENNATNISTSAIDYSWGISYSILDTDAGENCLEYIASLRPNPEHKDPYVSVYISIGVIAGCGVMFCVAIYLSRLIHKRGYLFSSTDISSAKYTAVIQDYPKHLGLFTELFNRVAISKGECCICKTDNIPVLRLNCNHAICMDDLKGYLTAALGDISMFPVKCPMHYLACTGIIDAKLARRALSEIHYKRFLEFSDRAMYGEGMRCIFCDHYVIFPADMSSIARVECPYCVQRFCIRCRKPWHVGGRCPLEMYDESLEVWKADSGAQKCPACKKLIEKDGPDTCNHMVHKIVDGIPCVRERTDFCYLCGEEVTPDYPHEEVRNPGVNHFPDGVFQNCRYVINKEKEAERERWRKQKRMKSSKQNLNPSQGSSKKSSILPAEGLVWENPQLADLSSPIASPVINRSGTSSNIVSPSRIMISDEIEAAPTTLFDQFDEEWDLALAHVHSGPLSGKKVTPLGNPSGLIEFDNGSSGGNPIHRPSRSGVTPSNFGNSRIDMTPNDVVSSTSRSSPLRQATLTPSPVVSASSSRREQRFVRHNRNALS